MDHLVKKEDFTSFTAAYPPTLIASPALTPARAIASSAPALAELSHDYGRNKSIAWLLSVLNAWQSAMPIQNKMTASQLHFLAENIQAEFFYLSASEFMLFLKQLMGGKFAVQWYNQLNPDTFISALRCQFLPHRDAVIHQKEMQQAIDRLSKEESKPITWEQYLKNHNLPPDRLSPLSVAAGLGQTKTP